jgi:hypothetical protein
VASCAAPRTTGGAATAGEVIATLRTNRKAGVPDAMCSISFAPCPRSPIDPVDPAIVHGPRCRCGPFECRGLRPPQARCLSRVRPSCTRIMLKGLGLARPHAVAARAVGEPRPARDNRCLQSGSKHEARPCRWRRFMVGGNRRRRQRRGERWSRPANAVAAGVWRGRQKGRGIDRPATPRRGAPPPRRPSRDWRGGPLLRCAPGARARTRPRRATRRAVAHGRRAVGARGS